jgi:hypothetical protein
MLLMAPTHTQAVMLLGSTSGDCPQIVTSGTPQLTAKEVDVDGTRNLLLQAITIPEVIGNPLTAAEVGDCRRSTTVI